MIVLAKYHVLPENSFIEWGGQRFKLNGKSNNVNSNKKFQWLCKNNISYCQIRCWIWGLRNYLCLNLKGIIEM